MFKKKGIVFVAAVVIVSVFVYYRYAADVIQSYKQGSQTQTVATKLPDGMREVSAVVKYNATEDKIDTLRFVLTVDKNGVVTDSKTLDEITGKIAEKKVEFNTELLVRIKGKKLSELSTIDKVGKSSLTTDAFNSVLKQLQAQL